MSLFRAMATVGSLTMLSRVLGFARDVLTAAYLGAGPIADAFFVALKLPNFFRRVTAEGAFSVSFVPMFAGLEETQGRAEALKFASMARSMMCAILIPFAIIMIIFMPIVISIITPGFTEDALRFDTAVELSRITFSYVVLISLVALYGGVLNSINKFAAFAVAPAFFNLTLIAAIIGLTPFTKSVGHAMAYGVLVSGFVQLFWMMLNCYRLKVTFNFIAPEFTARIKKLFRLMGPAIIGAGVIQINLFVDMILASFLPQGAISYLYYADRLYQLPLAVIGIAIGTALLPMMARMIRGGDMTSATKLTRDAIKYGLILSVPAAIALAVLSQLTMGVLFERGAFDSIAVLASSAALSVYVIGLPAYVLVKIFSTSFYAAEDTKTPVKFAIIATICNTLLSIALIKPLGHVGIALATAITAWLHVVLLAGAAKVTTKGLWQGQVMTIIKIVFAGLLMGGGLYYVDSLAQWPDLVKLLGLVIGGSGVYFALLQGFDVMRLQDMKHIFAKVKT